MHTIFCPSKITLKKKKYEDGVYTMYGFHDNYKILCFQNEQIVSAVQMGDYETLQSLLEIGGIYLEFRDKVSNCIN